MTDDRTMTIRLDDRIQMYKSFLDYAWVGTLEQTVRGTNLEMPIVSLLFALKATANAYAMPFFMMHSMKAFEEGYLRGRDSMPEEKLRLLAEQLPQRMARKHKLSYSKQKQFSEMIAEILAEVKNAKEVLAGIEMDETFSGFLFGAGGSELQLGVMGLCQICYGATFHAYEHFVTECIRWARGDKTFKAYKFAMIVGAVEAEFGQDVADFCLAHERVQLARAVRNALAHDGGRVAPDMFGKVSPDLAKKLTEKLHEEFFVEDDGVIRIVAANNLNLFEMLKLRVSRLVAKAVTLPPFVKN
jgi:hypothetical protein